MKIIAFKTELQERIKAWKADGKRIGFVPTMGALHQGHLSLVRKAQELCDVVIVSIFVNPTQFNDPKDLSSYPRTLEADSELLRSSSVDIIYAPSALDVYPNGLHTDTYEFGPLQNKMEAKNRPGHFDGVATVVSRLFDAVNPDAAFFGEKDFQQLQIIRSLVSQQKRNIEIVGCDIVREENGLAMSSRNQLLSEAAREDASIIYQSLKNLRSKAKSEELSILKKEFKEEVESAPNAELEYIEICEEEDLSEANDLSSIEHPRAFAVVRFEGVRLLDNLSIFP